MMTLSGVGRFVRDPEMKAVNDTHVCEFSLAVNEYRKVGGERKKFAHFFDFVIWDKAAEVINEYCGKGDLIEIRATPRQDKWQDGEGRNRSRVVFRVDEFSFLPRSTSSAKDETSSEAEEAEDDGTSPF
jgi:single-strand DNA-binding protein